jgi:hypothetical protein
VGRLRERAGDGVALAELGDEGDVVGRLVPDGGGAGPERGGGGGEGGQVRTASTPGAFSAARASMPRRRAWACGERTTTACAWRGRLTSSE